MTLYQTGIELKFFFKIKGRHTGEAGELFKSWIKDVFLFVQLPAGRGAYVSVYAHVFVYFLLLIVLFLFIISVINNVKCTEMPQVPEFPTADSAKKN